ncbi:MAG TPA: hypothetical protein VL095_01930 [Flavisolibacter sp.]|nr:hypothetical protein [Flavisolibacter sp.]
MENILPEHEYLFRKYPELRELAIFMIKQLEEPQRPAKEVILDDVGLRELLKVSKRTTAMYRSNRLISYSFLGGKVFYILEDVLEAIRRNRIPCLSEQLKIKL